MTDPTPTRRLPRPTPAWLVLALLVVEGLLWLSERYTWFWFNEKKGWTVMIAVASVGVAMLVMLGWFIVALVFRWRFQFSIRSLLVLVVVVAVPCSWLAVDMNAARSQREALLHGSSTDLAARERRRSDFTGWRTSLTTPGPSRVLGSPATPHTHQRLPEARGGEEGGTG